jgi:hypothetical protein
MRFDPPAADGMPAHVTVLYPFMPLQETSPRRLAAAFAAEPAFEVVFREVRRWPDVLYLAPDPPERFTRLTGALAARYPEWPPYEGAHDTVVPHLTVSCTSPERFDEIESALRPGLPVRAEVRDAVLMSQGPDDRWRIERRFRLRTPVPLRLRPPPSPGAPRAGSGP